MDWQVLIVGLIVLAAAAYVGRMMYLKVTALSTKPGCGSDCGCDSTANNKQMPQVNPR